MSIPIERIIRELSRPDAYAHTVDDIDVIQTHISVIFLAGDLVYKVKKPVDFGFLDFTTLEKRRHYCEEELRLNRRLSPGIYLDVVPVIDGPEGLRIAEHKGEHKVKHKVSETAGQEHRVTETTVEETAVEFAVVMRRLDESRLLSTLLPAGSVHESTMGTIAKRIADFHRKAETGPEITAKGGTDAVIFNTEENFRQIELYVGETLSKDTYDRIVRYTRTFLDVNRDLFARREAEGWIRDGHGDLHTQHICLSDGIQIFDCIEFNERFRYGDVLVDAAFLAMDLERLGYEELADEFSRYYLGMMDQSELVGLFNFYACYRAVVRGKVEGFRSRDPDIGPPEAQKARENAGAFFLLGEKYARTLVPPVLIAGCGLMGSGKSTLAKALDSYLDIVLLSSDRIRKELAGLDPTSPRHVPFGSDIYSREFSARTYGELHNRAVTLMKGGQSVFLDASYMTRDLRDLAVEAAREGGAGFLLVHMDPGEEKLRERLRKRILKKGGISDGREEILGDQIKAFKPPVEIPEEQKLTFTSSDALELQVRETFRRLLRTKGWSDCDS